MAKNAQFLAGAVIGIVIGAAAASWFWYSSSNEPTELWVSSEDLTLDNGATIPAGTSFVHHRDMPEGFSTLKLFVNVEGEDVDSFEVSTDDRPQLVIPQRVSK